MEEVEEVYIVDYGIHGMELEKEYCIVMIKMIVTS